MFLENFLGRSIPKAFHRQVVEMREKAVDGFPGICFQISFLRNELPHETDALFHRSFLPRGVRMTEERGDPDLSVSRVLHPIIKRQRLCGKRTKHVSETLNGILLPWDL